MDDQETYMRAAATLCTAVLTDYLRDSGCGPPDIVTVLSHLNISVIAYLISESKAHLTIKEILDHMASDIEKHVPGVVALYERERDDHRSH